MKTYAFRLKPGQGLREEIDRFVAAKDIKAGIVLSGVGNLKKAILRMADAQLIKIYEDSFEIVSITGTVEVGNSHLHISISDRDGHVFGGHLKTGSIIGVTAEIVIGELEGLEFERKFDNETGYDELIINKS